MSPAFHSSIRIRLAFLTLAVSLEAIFLSVFVLLSQNRQAAKDRVHADIEYDINLKAELEIAHLHEKLDRLTGDVLLRLERLQQALPKADRGNGAGEGGLSVHRASERTAESASARGPGAVGADRDCRVGRMAQEIDSAVTTEDRTVAAIP